MSLIIDIGNTRTKLITSYGINNILHEKTLSKLSVKAIKTYSEKYHNPGEKQDAILSSVTKTDKTVLKYLRTNFNFIELTHRTPLPIKNLYATPQTLGNDRLANAVAGAELFQNADVLIIDAGTCIKYDFTDHNKNYYGGAISPGLVMRYKALNHYTGQLPLIKPSSLLTPLTGTTTKDAIISGVQNGIVHEMNGMIDQYKQLSPLLKIILTGGDSPFFADRLKSSIFAAPNLTLQGLNEILNYNVRKNS